MTSYLCERENKMCLSMATSCSSSNSTSSTTETNSTQTTLEEIYTSIISVLTSIVNLEELKRGTDVCNNVISVAQKLLSLPDKTPLLYFAMNLRLRYSRMVDQTRLISTKIDKLWTAFHYFSTQEGIQLCHELDTGLSLKAVDTFWQLVMKKEFVACVKDFLVTPSSSGGIVSNTSCRKLNDVEMSAI